MKRIFQFLPLMVTLLSSFVLYNSTTYAVNTIFDQRFERIKKQAATGDKRAQYRLGLAYMLGNDVKVNIGESIYWLGKSAKQGYVKAAHKIGVLYYNNRDGRKNYGKAVRWFTIAAKRNYAPSQYYLAKMYFIGKGIPRDLDFALVWSARAGKNGMDTKRQIRQIERAIKLRAAKTHIAAKKKKKIRTKQKLIRTNTPSKAVRPGIYNARSTRHVLELVLSGYWALNDKPADHMPSSVNKCAEKNGAVHCKSERISRSTKDYRADYTVNSTFFNFNRSGQFNVQYRVTYIFVLPSDPDDPDPSYQMPTAGRSTTVTILNCQILSKKKIRCKSPDKKIEEHYSKNE